jgi:monovalent cation:H+ antiporter, CPA1 family
MLELVPALELGLIAVAVAVAAKFVRIPYTIALVLAGLVVGLSGLLDVHLSKDLILLLFLPPLLFEGALHMDLTYLRRYATPVGMLALFGTLLSAGVIGLIAHLTLGLDWGIALLLGIMLSPTDPVSVLAMFKQYGVPKGLQTLLEGESVFNDGIGIVLFVIALEVLSGGEFSLGGSLIEFLKVALGGAVVGLASGYLVHRLIGQINDHLLEVMISVVLAFGSYALAESLHVSGVVSTVVAGLIIGNYGTTLSMSPTARLSLVNFWAVISFIVNSAVFLLIGVDFDTVRLPANLTAILVAIGAVLIGRALSVYGLGSLSNALQPKARRLPASWLHALNWGGLRGTIPIALALGLGPELRDVNGIHIPTVVFGVALFSLVVQGLTMKPLLTRLGLIGNEAHRIEFETRLAESLALRASLTELEELHARGEIGNELFLETRTALQHELHQTSTALARLSSEVTDLRESLQENLNRRLAQVQRAAVADATRRGLIGEEASESVNERVDVALDTGQRPSLRFEPEA